MLGVTDGGECLGKNVYKCASCELLMVGNVKKQQQQQQQQQLV